MTGQQPTLWSDQDGVIAIYDMNLYRKSEHNPNPLFFQANAHCYQTCLPDQRIINCYEKLNRKMDLHVLTNLTHVFPLWMEHQQDKIQWTMQHLPFLDIQNQYHTIHSPKWKFAQEFLHRPLQKTDILISDYNEDLIPWNHAGGTAVKYLNDINSPDSYTGPHIMKHWNEINIIDYILQFAQ